MEREPMDFYADIELEASDECVVPTRLPPGRYRITIEKHGHSQRDDAATPERCVLTDEELVRIYRTAVQNNPDPEKDDEECGCRAVANAAAEKSG